MFITCGVCGAQNLVPNPSFEQYYSCPPGANQVDSCIGWHKFGGVIGLVGTPDYFDTCSTFGQNSVPNNYFGGQAPFHGGAYMGLFTYDWTYWYREYIGADLLDTMVPGANYSISMRVSSGNTTPQQYMCLATNKMGVRLTTSGYSFDSLIPVNNYAQLYDNSIISDTLNWVLLGWNFIADSAYTHIYIGNFFESDSTDTIHVDCPSLPGRAYYYIDSINIVCTSAICFTDLNEIKNDKILISPNPFSDKINITGKRNELVEVNLYDITSRKIFHQSFTISASINTEQFAKGVYLYELRNKRGVIKKGKLVKN